MSPTAEVPTADITPGEVRTYRGRTVEELVPQIRAELGAGAIILRERRGVTGGVAGFFARRCVEVDAQAPPRLDVYADEDDELGVGATEAFAAPAEVPAAPVVPALPAPPVSAAPASFAPAPTPAVDPFADFAARLAAAQAAPDAAAEALETAPISAERVSAAPPAPERAAAEFIAFDELEAPAASAIAAAPAITAAPARVAAGPAVAEPAAPTAIAIPIALDVADPAEVFRPAPPAMPTSAVFRATTIATLPAGAGFAVPAALRVAPAQPHGPELIDALRERLAARGLRRELADELVASARARSDAGEQPGIAAAAQATLAAILPVAAPLPSTGAIAVVGSGGAGKSRTVTGLALALARGGHAVSVVRLDGAGHDDAALHDEPGVEIIATLRTQATAELVAGIRHRRLVIVDTAAASPGDPGALEVLAETLAPFAPDRILLCAPATFTTDALARLAAGYAGLPIDALVATHADEAEELGTVAEMSAATGLAVGHVHAGLDATIAISDLDPARLAGHLLR